MPVAVRSPATDADSLDLAQQVPDHSLRNALILSALCLITLLALVAPGGDGGRWLREALGYAFGWGSFLVPVVSGAFAVAVWRRHFAPSFHMTRSEATGWGLTFVTLVGILQLIDGNPIPRWPTIRGGGWLGSTLWLALDRALGPSSGIVILTIVGAAAIALLFDQSVEDLVQHIQAAVTHGRSLLDHLTSITHSFGHASADSTNLGQRASDSVDESTDPSELVNQSATLAETPVVDATPEIPIPRWLLPPVTLLKSGSSGELSQADLDTKISIIEDTLADFDVFAHVVQVNPGPTVTQFGLEPGFREKRDRHGTVVKREKIKVSEITGLTNDLALALAAPSIRIEAPVPGRQVVGLEVPNGQTTLVSLRQIVESSAFQKLRLKTRLTVALGEDVSGQAVAADLAKMPHLLIAGATGSGKSVCVNAIISCLLLQATPEEVRLILVDPKRVELTTYNDVPHLLRPVVVDVDKVVGVLKWVVHEMDDRYKLFEVHGVRNIEGYNRLAGTRAGLNQLPYIVVVIDELADLMMLAPDETERLLCRLAQLARATGIHLVVATQRPSVDVITGLIKANFPTRISFAVTSQIDSRTILDTPGAEKLLGRGDMLFMPTDAAKPVRLQGVFVSDEEIEALVQHWQDLGPPNYVDQLVHAPSTSDATEETDDLYAKAEEVAREHTRISTSLLQRRLRIGYSRAARLIDTLEQRGVVGPAEGGGRSREVHHEPVDLAEPTVPHLES